MSHGSPYILCLVKSLNFTLVASPYPFVAVFKRMLNPFQINRRVTWPPTNEEFEELVASALKMDRNGISGKHRKDDDKHEG